jgi:hypothetical protein
MIEIIRKKLENYPPNEQENALKEILQEIALFALWRADFFEVALFQGGTSLRILYGLPRFSEDLDFMLRTADANFQWAPYLGGLVEAFKEYGLKLEAEPKERMDRPIREALLKDDSTAQQLNLQFPTSGRRSTIKIKLEIDTNPPALSGEDTSFLDFPSDHEVRHQDLSSNLALKIHALLCRPYLKGRDWFDFSWYVSKGVSPNLPHLQAALLQQGPWCEDKALKVDPDWLQNTLKDKIATVNWDIAKEDVRRFLRATEARSLNLWGEAFFNAKVDKLF